MSDRNKTTPSLRSTIRGQKVFLCLLAVLTLFIASEALPQALPTESIGTGVLRIEVRNGLVSMDVRDADITRVLTAIAEQAHVELSLGDGVTGMVSARMDGVAIEDALRRLCANRALLFSCVPETNIFNIVGIGAYPGGGSEGLSRAMPSDGPGTQEPEAGSAAVGGRIADSGSSKTDQGPDSRYDRRGRLRYRPGELLVIFREGVTEEQIARTHAAVGSRVIEKMERLRLYRVRLAPGMTEEEATRHYSESDLVKTVERHIIRYADEAPDDTYFSEQWGLTVMETPEAWGITTGTPDTVIAVIDTGVDYLHADLVDNIWVNEAEITGEDELDDDGNGYVDDCYGWDFAGATEAETDADADPRDVDGHGTHVAGIIAALGNNRFGVAGVCWDAKIMVLKVEADTGGGMSMFDVLEALDYAQTKGARIVNCSFGGSTYSLTEYMVFRDLGNNGILAVCSAGNDGIDTDRIGNANYPASYDLDNIISVAASDPDDSLASFSNYGLTSVDVMAPGYNIFSTRPADTSTDASVTVAASPSPLTFDAEGMTYGGTTGPSGLTRFVHDCGLGYEADFPAEVSGQIALIERGELTFADKTANALNAGAEGVIIYNNDTGNFFGTLMSPGDWVPVVSVSQEDGNTLKTMIAVGPVEVTLCNVLTDNSSFYVFMSGTSMSAPHVSGVAGLLLAKTPDFTSDAVKAAILDTVDKVDSVADKMVSGGRVNVRRALCTTIADPGDLTGDGTVTLGDAVEALQVISGLQPEVCPVCEPVYADVNNDEKIGIEEVLYILQSLAELHH